MVEEIRVMEDVEGVIKVRLKEKDVVSNKIVEEIVGDYEREGKKNEGKEQGRKED